MHRLTVADLREETKSFRIPFGRWTVSQDVASFYYGYDRVSCLLTLDNGRWNALFGLPGDQQRMSFDGDVFGFRRSIETFINYLHRQGYGF